MEKVKVYYRLSDHGYQKIKPDFINNEKCLNNFLRNFMELKNTDLVHDDDIIVIADGVSDNTFDWLKNKNINVERTQFGSGGHSWNYTLDEAVKLEDDTIVYFVEDDYLHLPNSRNILIEAFTQLGAHYVSLYDHPDKYIDADRGGNPYIRGGGEDTTVVRTKSCHWKITNSTTMTFASRVRTLKEDFDILKKWTIGNHTPSIAKGYPEDMHMFVELRNEKQRALVTPLPGFSTHGETNFLTPYRDWSKV